MTKKISGTKEWAVVTINCSIGCNRNCYYCYGRRISALRGDISSYSEWPKKNEICRDIKKETTKYSGTVMFPSMHDIHPGNLEVCIDVIGNILKAGNKILITSKPQLECIQRICNDFKNYKDKILFRFTIGTLNNKILKLWEPGAPSAAERTACLAYARSKRFQTSVSMEPMLNSLRVVEEAKVMLPFITDGLWIGKMNKIEDRVINISQQEKDRIRAGQNNTEIKRIHNSLKYEPKIRWKESFKEVLGLKLSTEIGADQ